MGRMFLYQTWLAGALTAFTAAHQQPTLQGRPILLSPRQYGAALLQAYFGRNSLAWIAEVADLPVATLADWRREPGFLLVMDGSKAQFAEFFKETLVLTDFPWNGYVDIAGEFSLLEDSLRVRVRLALYEIFGSLAEKLLSHHRHGLALDTYDLSLFRPLFLFFLALEHYWPSAAGQRLRQQFIPLARAAVWPALELPWPEEVLTTDQERVSLPALRQDLRGRLRETFTALSRLH
jgi:hypothetical protein